MAISSNLNDPTAYRSILKSLHDKLAGASNPPAAPSASTSTPSTYGSDTYVRSGSTYTVQPGDTLATIAQHVLGDPSRWREIYELNRQAIPNPNMLGMGQVLALPANASPSVSTPPSSPPADTYVRSGATYTVRAGDSLESIAQRMLGDAGRWHEIYDLNRQIIQNPNLIYSGQVLVLPGNASSSTSQLPAAPPSSSNVSAGPQPPVLNLFHQLIQEYTSGQMGPVSPDQLKLVGQSNKEAFFAALRPGAEEAEKLYGVPAAVTLAQAALESGWGKSALGGYNIFGIKGTGPAGTTQKMTSEYIHGHYVRLKANFALYSSFNQAIMEHGKLFHNGYYNKAIAQYQQDHDPRAFARNIQGIYATSPTYANDLISIIDKYHLA